MNRILEKVVGIFKGKNQDTTPRPVLFSLSGCPKCKLVKEYMQSHNIPFSEKDVNTSGKQEFRKFHMANFNSVVHTPEGGVPLPIFVQGNLVLQGIGNILSHLTSGKTLAGFFSVGVLHMEWIDGIHIDQGDPEDTEEFFTVLRYLKGHNFRLQIDTTGLNSSLLKKVLDESLADSVIMDVLAPRDRYAEIAGKDIDLSEIEKSLVLIPQFPQYQFQTTVFPIKRKDNTTPGSCYLTAMEVEETSLFIKEATGSDNHPYLLKISEAGTERFKDFKAIEAKVCSMMRSYFFAAKTHQGHADIDLTSREQCELGQIL